MTNDTVVPLRPGIPISSTEPAPHPDTVAELEELLDKALSGRLRGIAFASVDHDLAVEYNAVGMIETMRLIGALEVLKNKLIETVRADEEPDEPRA